MKKWVQAENGNDEKLDIWVEVDTPELVPGQTERLDTEPRPVLLGPDGKPLARKRRFGFNTGYR